MIFTKFDGEGKMGHGRNH